MRDPNCLRRARWWREPNCVGPALAMFGVCFVVAWLITTDGCPRFPPVERRTCLGRKRAATVHALQLQTPGMQKMGFQGLRERFGDARVYAQQSSKTREDTTDGRLGGQPERRMRLRAFIDSISRGQTARHNYVKMLDDNPAMWQLETLGASIETELRAAVV